MNSVIRLKTISLISKLLRPLMEEGLVTVPELTEIVCQLKNIAQKGTTLPPIVPKLIDQQAAAEMLGIGLSNFKKLEKEGEFSFQRKMVGSAVRYRNTDIISFILASNMESKVE